MSKTKRRTAPADLVILPRDRRFGRREAARRWWHGGDPVATAVFNALSATFPMGEAYFIESVRKFRDGVEGKLADEIRAFIAQEVVHSREHLAFNRRAAESGYDLAKLEERVRSTLDQARARPPIVNLAATMALEHFTAILAHQLLKDPRHLQGADPETAELWRWHAAEEIEHKGVAFDAWLHATRNWTRFGRWRLKTLVMLRVTRDFLVHRTEGALELLRQDGMAGPEAWARLFWYVCVQPGMLRKIAAPWASYFLPGFHPWNEDDRALTQVQGTAIRTISAGIPHHV